MDGNNLVPNPAFIPNTPNTAFIPPGTINPAAIPYSQGFPVPGNPPSNFLNYPAPGMTGNFNPIRGNSKLK